MLRGQLMSRFRQMQTLNICTIIYDSVEYVIDRFDELYRSDDCPLPSQYIDEQLAKKAEARLIEIDSRLHALRQKKNDLLDADQLSLDNQQKRKSSGGGITDNVIDLAAVAHQREPQWREIGGNWEMHVDDKLVAASRRKSREPRPAGILTLSHAITRITAGTTLIFQR